MNSCDNAIHYHVHSNKTQSFYNISITEKVVMNVLLGICDWAIATLAIGECRCGSDVQHCRPCCHAGCPVGVEVDLAHFQVLLCALFFICIVVTKNKGPISGSTKKTFEFGWMPQYMWNTTADSILKRSADLCLDLRWAVWKEVELVSFQAVSSCHDPSFSDQGSST